MELRRLISCCGGLRLVRVCGHSMAPTIPHNAYVLVRAYGARDCPGPGDICVFRATGGMTMIKRLTHQTGNGRFALRGDGPLSACSIDLEPVAGHEMLGRVILTLRPAGEGRWPFAPNKAALKNSPHNTQDQRSLET
ncbi:MAG: S24/S26 family peptidase [Pseudomonadota bacterium]